MNGTTGDDLATIRARVDLDAERSAVSFDPMNGGMFCTDYAPGMTGEPMANICVVHDAYWPDEDDLPVEGGEAGCVAVDARAARWYLDVFQGTGESAPVAEATIAAASR